MTRAEYTMIATLVDRARRAQLDAEGGYRKVEADAKGHERTLDRLQADRCCAQCGTRYQPRHGGSPKRFCSEACRKLWNYYLDPATAYQKRADRRRRARLRVAA